MRLLLLSLLASLVWGAELRLQTSDNLHAHDPLPEGCVLPSAKLTGPRPPGKLLLNMLIKNEEVHLERTLPKWAKIIDYWIVGVDDNNTDSSPQVIMKHLGHIPGEIVIVHFDGMGPTWSKLVDIGIKKYPQATHGIIADADYAPMYPTFDKMDLDIRCSKHMFTIWTEDHQNERKMDWIYRNVCGAKVKRRTHQVVEVPPLPDQEVFQTLVNLHVDEAVGGYGDRSGDKHERYMHWLEKDLEEYPGDTRTLYYLAYANFEIFLAKSNNPTQKEWDHLSRAVELFKERGAITQHGFYEERWFALLKIGEIYERFYQNWSEASKYYKMCIDSDGDRADPWFYHGQHYRLVQDWSNGVVSLWQSAALPIPTRSLFQWLYLYNCLSKLELARILVGFNNQLEESKATSLPSNLAESIHLRRLIAAQSQPQQFAKPWVLDPGMFFGEDSFLWFSHLCS